MGLGSLLAIVRSHCFLANGFSYKGFVTGIEWMLFNRAYTADSTCEKKGKLPTWVIDYQHNDLFVLILFPFLKEEVKFKKKKNSGC